MCYISTVPSTTDQIQVKRNELIVDEDGNEDNDCEQSDTVQILLNLALIEEKFAKEIKFQRGLKK